MVDLPPEEAVTFREKCTKAKSTVFAITLMIFYSFLAGFHTSH
jgi:hypothetical protein